jgi:hypothetical protein
MLWWVERVIVYDEVCGGGFSVNVEGECVVCVIDGHV